MDGHDEVKKHAVKYEASNQIFFKKLFKNIEWHFKDSTFVDFGCGKGAALVYASGFEFKKLIGIEFSKQLSEIASCNLRKHMVKTGRIMDYEIINLDASEYIIPAEADCFYFFNPFDEFLLDRVLQNIIRSLEENQRKILIVYMNALHHVLVEKYGFKKIKYLSPKELDIYYTGGAFIYANE